MIEILLLAAVAAFVLFRLISVMGKEKGAPPPAYGRQNEPEAPTPVRVSNPEPDNQFDEDVAGGLEQIHRLDPSFNQKEFINGARMAYEMIVKAFADGDRGTLVPLLTESVFKDYDNAMKALEESGDPPLELVRLKDASIEDGSVNGSVAEVSVLFEAELSNGDRISKTNEVWTFERDTQSRDPNWRLSNVSAA